MGDRLLPTVLTALLVVVVFALIGLGWRNRLKRQQTVAGLPEVPAGLGEPLLAVAGTYVATTSAGDWLDRIAVHALGIRTTATVEVHPAAVLIRRSGAPDLYIDAQSLTEVRLESGMAGKFVEKDGLVVLGWTLGETPVDTGFRTRAAAEKTPLLHSLENLVPPHGTTTESTQA
ncbi:PH-like domain-containing protein [Arthrobacter sp. 35W]|uniref:PH-like domain-containing protein n=1 Tax=Arthrobacter sp. 35W TaxID=1132441 RepID=UPI000403C29C|nr:hypothetical protein [Arthrobacter sp. 35W]